MPEPDPRWSLHRTPNPAEKSFSVVIGNSEIADAMADFDAYAEGSLFSDFPLIPDQDLASDSRFGQYRFSECADEGPANMRFFFGKNKTPEEANDPFRSTWKKFGNHRWMPILKGIAIIQDYSFPRSTNAINLIQQGIATAPSNYDRVIYVPDCNEGTRFRVDEFISPVAFKIPRHRTPVATSVQYSVNGLRGEFQECLHGDIEIPASRTGNAEFFGTSGSVGSGSIEGQSFPATNFKTWIPYVVYDEQELQSGIWYRQRIRVYPPLRPKVIRR